MRYRFALAALVVGVVGAAASAPAPAQAADVFLHGRIGDVFVGIDSRDHFGRFDRDRHRRRGHRRHFDPFDPRVDRDQFNERLERRFTFEKLFNGGTAFSHDRRRRALEGWPPPREVRPYHDDDRPYYRYGYGSPGILLPEGHYLREERGFDDGGVSLDPPPGAVRGSEAALPPAATAPRTPDPRGPRRAVTRATGTPPAIGQRLPRGRPHVALDWQDYDLPEPPPGHGYVRFDGTVLLIENGTRVVREVL